MKTHFSRVCTRFSLALRFVLVFALFGVSSLGNSARADGTFVSVPGRFDFVHDAARGFVYISSGPQVLRYRGYLI